MHSKTNVTRNIFNHDFLHGWSVMASFVYTSLITRWQHDTEWLSQLLEHTLTIQELIKRV